MSVAGQLGLDEANGVWLIQAAERWPGWAASEPALGVVAGPRDLRGWLRTADPIDADAVLKALVRLASPTGGDDLAAAMVVAWALLPGACSLARRLQTLTPRIDEVVAAQLWLEIRGFAWQRLDKVAANILADTRTGVLRECGSRSQLRRCDRTWSQTTVAEPGPALDTSPGPPGPSASGSDRPLLARACRAERGRGAGCASGLGPGHRRDQRRGPAPVDVPAGGGRPVGHGPEVPRAGAAGQPGV